MKKICLLIILLLGICGQAFAIGAPSPSFTWITKDQCAIGGIKLGMKSAQVIQAYGEPTKYGKATYRNQNVVFFQYRNDLRIYAAPAEGDYEVKAIVTASNQYKTFNGVHVGMNIAEAMKIVGDKPHINTHDGRTTYTYQVDSGREIKLIFTTLANSSAIVSISTYMD